MEQAQYISFFGLGNVDVYVLISCVTVTAILAFIAWLLGDVKVVPTGLQALLEHIWQWLEGLAISQMGPIGKRYVPFCMAIFLYILVANWIGLIPNVLEWIAKASGPPEASPILYRLAHILEPATTSVNVTLAMAIISFVAFMALGIHRSIERATQPAHGDHGHGEHGHGHSHDQPTGVVGGVVSWIGHYIQPVPSLWNSMEGALKYGLVPMLLILFVFLNIVEELARVLSLTFRLFGNIFGDHQVKLQLVALIGVFGADAVNFAANGIIGFVGYGVLTIVMWGTVLFVVCLGTLAGFIQAFVFSLLTMSYIAHAVADSH